MLTLYYKPTCPFCQKVLNVAEELGVEFNLKDISADDAAAEELVSLGGKRQVPYLVDEQHDKKMYESDEIIEHLRAHHNDKKAGEDDSPVSNDGEELPPRNNDEKGGEEPPSTCPVQ